MKIVFACGGTGGHINPALGVAGYIRSRHPEAEISFIGNEKGMESRLIPKAGYPFYPIHVAGFQRKISVKNVGRNINAAVKAVTSTFEAGSLLKDLNPDIVVGMGGYVSGPVLRKAHKMGFKTATHEQNAFPGVTTKMLVKDMDLVMLAMPEAEKLLPERKYIITGNPVRTELLHADRDESRKKLSLDDRPMILSFGGSLGARNLNAAMADVIAWHWKDQKCYHFHGTGKREYETMMRELADRGVDLNAAPQISVLEYIDNMDVLMSAADLVVCRAGASTLSELEILGKASILIPSPNVAENHQYHNAMTLAKRGAAVVIEEKELTAERIIDEISRLCSDPDKLIKMGKNASDGAFPDSNERIYHALMELLAK